MAAGINLKGLERLPNEMKFIILSQDLSIGALSNLRRTSKDLRSTVDQFVKDELEKLSTKGPSFARAFLATQEARTKDNAWAILGLFKRAYPSLPLNMSIEKASQQLAMDQATIALKDALVEENPQDFADLGSKQTAEQIREWFENPINLPLLQGVTVLDLGGRGLSLVPSELRFLSNLSSLYLHQNQITVIDPQTFANLQNLMHLNLNENSISGFNPETFANLTRLVSLSLYKNKIASLPPGLFDKLINLHRLTLASNEITSIPPRLFCKLAQLDQLSFSRNKITVLDPEGFEGLNNLTFVTLINNNIGAIGSKTFALLTKLRVLLLDNNKIENIDVEVFSALSQLRTLGLSCNEIKDIAPDAFTQLQFLEFLNLEKNRITASDPVAFANLFARLSSLKHLNLRENEVAVDPRNFAALTSLEELYGN
jgi:hypothetical protein